MAFVSDSRFAGYLGPDIPPGPLEDDPWEDFLHGIVAGVTGLPDNLVRPRWQIEPPLRPDIGVNWCAYGVMRTENDYAPVFVHISEGEGYDALQQMEKSTIMCSFYGPQSEQYCSFLQRGLWVDQNHAVMRANGIGLVEVSGTTRAAELVKERWWPRNDVSFVLRREIRYNYNVRNLLRAKVNITASTPDDRYITDNVDTAETVIKTLILSAGPVGILQAGNRQIVSMGQSL